MTMRRLQITFAMLLIASTGNAQSQQMDFGSMTPFAMGRVTGQVHWSVENCGGKLSNSAMKHSERALLTDRGEFMKGVETGVRDMEAKRALGNTAELCALARFTYGAGGVMPGLWNH